MDQKQVGGEVDAYCTKCRMLLGHTIVAMVGDKIARVRCNTCMGDHAFRANAPGTKAAKAPKEAAPARSHAKATASRAKAEAKPFESLFNEKSMASAQRYSPRGHYAVGDVLEHPSFGLGLVESVRDDKLDAIFKGGPKTLIHALGEAPTSFEKTPRRAGVTVQTASADKPPPGQPSGLHVVHSEPPTELPAREEQASPPASSSDS